MNNQTSITEVKRDYDRPGETIVTRIDGHLASCAQQFYERPGTVLLYQHGREAAVGEWTWSAWLTIGGVEVSRHEAGDDVDIHFKDATASNDGTGHFTRRLSGATQMIRSLIGVGA